MYIVFLFFASLALDAAESGPYGVTTYAQLANVFVAVKIWFSVPFVTVTMWFVVLLTYVYTWLYSGP